ncbi:hypothetical protein CEXT_269981 [Caerostris extrusa]|uniref:Uncharacterized protein n=1 Tax=Caerostris extrusa TaxID=172846 RepID=A0AAV4P1S0_CAEEX|nr:hypothetical protein CEXT_269981 [Caerostris extrusa]
MNGFHSEQQYTMKHTLNYRLFWTPSPVVREGPFWRTVMSCERTICIPQMKETLLESEEMNTAGCTAAESEEFLNENDMHSSLIFIIEFIFVDELILRLCDITSGMKVKISCGII